MDVYARLKELNIELPPAPPAGGVYSPYKQFAGNLIYTSGCGPTAPDGSSVFAGKVGQDLTLEEAQEAARLATLNILGMLHARLGDLNRIKQIIKMLGFVACTPDFYQQPQVMNGSSELLISIFGDPEGRPARSAIATNVLPGNIPVEIELIIELKD